MVSNWQQVLSGVSYGGTYSHEQMLIKILAFAILLGFVLNSASFIQVDALNKYKDVSWPTP